jgi:hypothetical protein
VFWLDHDQYLDVQHVYREARHQRWTVESARHRAAHRAYRLTHGAAA